MKVSFAVLVFYHFFVSTSMASSVHGWKKSRGVDIGVNRIETHQQLYSVTGSRRVLASPNYGCYKQFFAGDRPPTGFRQPQLANIKYICQQIEEFSDETLYVTMFDENIGIAVYAGYMVPKGAAPLIGTFPRIQKWTMDGDIQRQGYNNAYDGNVANIQKGHLVPASTYSFDCLSMVSTFKYTNAVPQYKQFNIGPWKRYEGKVREFANGVCRFAQGNLFLLTGTSEAVISQNGIVRKQNLAFFPDNNRNVLTNIAIPNSMWTAGCCIVPGKGTLGAFAAIGNNKQGNNKMWQVTVRQLEQILAIGIGQGAAIILFPGNHRCSYSLIQYKYKQGQWLRANKLL